MSDILKFENLQDRIIEIRGQSVLLDADVAEIYGVETKRINEAVKNNTDKFPAGYIMELDKTEWDGLKSKFSTSTKGGKVKLPSAFPEKVYCIGGQPPSISISKIKIIFYCNVSKKEIVLHHEKCNIATY